MWKITSVIRHINKKTAVWALIVLIVLLCVIVCCLPKDSQNVPAEQTAPAPKVHEPIVPLEFSSSEIPHDVRLKMQGVTISEKTPVSYEDLAYLTLSFVGYDGKTHIGNMIVAEDIADEVIEIFKELYNIKFPIDKMRLPCEYGGEDELSMRDNNTSAFNDRPIEGSGAMSYHQLGRAIDINPLVNPYIRFSDGEVLPQTAHKYLDRSLEEKGMIKEDSPCVEIFKKHGWTWGGDWTSVKDYQHFEKK